MADLESKLAALTIRSLSFGYRTLRLVDPNELRQAQVGYSRTSDDHDLTDSLPGSWNPAWVVIGFEDECGDPVFVDTADADFPVFTARHGDGDWQEEKIAESFAQFAKVLRFLKPISQGRESPKALQENPLEDTRAIVDKIGDVTACPESLFWTLWFGEDS